MGNIESRVTDLEIQITHQIKMLDDLNSIIILQQKQIEKVENINSSIIQKINVASGTDYSLELNDLNEKPPSY